MTGSIILDTTKDLEMKIENFSVENGSTFEITNVFLRMNELNFTEEKHAIWKYLRSVNKLETFLLKEKQEQYHYKMLQYTLMQKIEFNKFYFKEECEGSRKLIAHSEDCISTIQILFRKDLITEVSVHMRSSDVKNLLPVDLLNILRLVKNVKLFGTGSIKEDINITVLIGSAHIYPAGDARRNNE